MTDAHRQRIEQELKAAGASSYGANKFASRYLPNIIHDDEHVKAAVYGRYKEDGGIFSFSAGMLVATDRRIIFLDHKPGFTTTDELTYDVVAGVKKTTSGLLSTVILHTRVADYVIRFANATGADKFVSYIESRQLETEPHDAPSKPEAPIEAPKIPTTTLDLEPEAMNYLRTKELGVLSTVSRSGEVHGAAVYYFVNDDDQICIITKSSTQKARDMFANQQSALTVYDGDKAQIVQLSGISEVETDPKKQTAIFAKLVVPRTYNGVKQMPPVTKIHEESYVAIKITPTHAHFVDYSKRD